MAEYARQKNVKITFLAKKLSFQEIFNLTLTFNFSIS